MTPALAALIAAGLLGLGLLRRRHRAALKAARRRLFDQVLPLLDSYRVTQHSIAHPVLEGRFRGHRIRLEPVVDQLTFRKLPSLWLLVTVFGRVPYRGSFDLLMRAQNTEFWSPAASFDHAVALPAGWPPEASLRSDDPAAMPPQHLLDRHVRLCGDPAIKELLVTPRGVRLVYLLGQGERGTYLVLRQARFPETPLPADLARALLEAALALLGDLGGRPDEPAAGPAAPEPGG
jgi:hypothetical protein